MRLEEQIRMFQERVEGGEYFRNESMSRSERVRTSGGLVTRSCSWRTLRFNTRTLGA